MVFFWACEVTETKAAVVNIPESYVLNVCNATLASAATEGVVSLGVETAQMDGKPWKGVVAHLGAAAHAHQVKLDLVVGAASSQVKFYVAKGTGKVNVTGYFQPGPPADLFDEQIELVPNQEEPKADKTKSKKRARDEKQNGGVTWDQAGSDSEEDEEKAPAKPEPVKKQAKTEEKKLSTPAPKPQQSQPQANGEGAKKKNRKKNKKNKDKKDN